MKGPEQLNMPSVLKTLRIRVHELKQDRDTARAQLKTVEQERHALARAKAELYLAEKQNQCLLTKVQQVKKERNTAKAKLETVEQERDNAKAALDNAKWSLEWVEQQRDSAMKGFQTAIAEWARLEKAAYGTP